jgi:hypothetical protein
LPSLAAGKSGSGLIWFVSKDAIGALTSAGKATLYPASVGTPCKAFDVPQSIALGPNGEPWYTETICNNHGIGTLVGAKASNVVFQVDNNRNPIYSFSSASQHQIALGSDGNLFFVAVSCGVVNKLCEGPKNYAVGRLTPKGVATFLNLPLTPACTAGYIVPGGDGNLWFVTCAPGAKTSAVYRITPAGVVTRFGGLTTAVSDVAQGPDGNLYCTYPGGIARLLTTGTQIGRVDYYYAIAGVPGTGPIGVGSNGLLYVGNSAHAIDPIVPPSP